jgi:hypothetical protein
MLEINAYLGEPCALYWLLKPIRLNFLNDLLDCDVVCMLVIYLVP